VEKIIFSGQYLGKWEVFVDCS